jgi:hypothetical protein
MGHKMKYETGTIGHLRHLIKDISDFVPVVFYSDAFCNSCEGLHSYAGKISASQKEVEEGHDCVVVYLHEDD